IAIAAKELVVMIQTGLEQIDRLHRSWRIARSSQGVVAADEYRLIRGIETHHRTVAAIYSNRRLEVVDRWIADATTVNGYSSVKGTRRSGIVLIPGHFGPAGGGIFNH